MALFSQEFTSNWMKILNPLINKATLLELSLPGAHDALTNDLSTTIADDANDLEPWEAYVLHDLRNFADIGSFIRYQATSQGLTLTRLLDAGIRFIDFRVTYSSSDNKDSGIKEDFYGLHLVETKETSLTSLKEIKDWVTQHPQEIIVVWISRHGSTCETTYPNVSDMIKQSFWNRIEEIFGDLLIDSKYDTLNKTTIEEYLRNNRRVLIYVSDGQDPSGFTGGSSKAFNGCSIDNHTGNDFSQIKTTSQNLLEEFAQAHSTIQNDSNQSKFYLQSLAASSPDFQIKAAAELEYIPFDHSQISSSCAQGFNIPGMVTWCPQYLMDMSLLLNYYIQDVLEISYNEGYDFPNALYVDAVDQNGLIRTGTQKFGHIYPSTKSHLRGATSFQTTGYAYVATIAGWNARKQCSRSFLSQTLPCQEILEQIERIRRKNPVNKWNDPQTGRLTSL
jgi:hypothetical protein